MKCFAAGLLLALGAQPALAQTGIWQQHSAVDDVTRQNIVWTTLLANTAASDGARPSLTVRCKDDTTEMFIDWGRTIADEAITLRSLVRVGDASAVPQDWTVATSNDAIFAPAWAGTILRQMKGENELAVRVHAEDGSQHSAVFDLRGMVKAVHPIAEACNWSL